MSCDGRGGWRVADDAHLRYYEAAPRKAMEAAVKDLAKLRAMCLVAFDAGNGRYSR